MATRKVLQEIPILMPQTEHQTFQIIEEETPESNRQISSPAKLHTKYISNDESKENISPAEFESVTKEEKSAVTVAEEGGLGNAPPSDLSDPRTSDYWDNLPVSCDSSSKVGTYLTPSKDGDGQQDACTTPMDFSKVTVEELGISSDSLLKYVGKSPQSLRKYRRRSNIGVRGSPEMNFLIKQIALRKSNAKPEPEPLANPFTSPRNSVLRDKISAFRNAFQAVDENEGKPSVPGFSEEADNGTVMKAVVEPPAKRKREDDATTTVISNVPVFPSQTLENIPKSRPHPAPEKIVTDCSGDSALVPEVSKVSAEVKAEDIPSKPRKRKVMFADFTSQPDQEMSRPVPESPPKLRPVLKKTPRKEYTHFRFGFVDENRVIFSVPESSDNEENIQKADPVKQKKRVTFGRELSPEMFDKTLPANTPLRRGSTPYSYRKSDNDTPAAPEGVSQSPYQSLLQPNFDDQDKEETLQPLSLCFDTETSGAGASPLVSSPGHTGDTMSSVEVEDGKQRENEQSSHESEEEPNATVSVTETITNASETFIGSELEMEPAGSRKTRFSYKKKSSSSEETHSCVITPATDSTETPVTTKNKTFSRKIKKPVIAKKVQIKGPRAKRGRKPKKTVQKPLYEHRETVSKRPLLSPIPELPECFPTPPASSPAKTLVKKLTKTRGVRKIQVKKVHQVLEGSTGHTLSMTEGHQAPDIQEGSEQHHSLVKEADSPTKDQHPTAPPVSDMDPHIVVLSGGCPPPAARTDAKDESCQLAPVTCVTMSESKNTKKTRKQSSKTPLTTRKRVSINASNEGQSEMSSSCVTLEHSVDHCSPSPLTITDEPTHETIAHILSDGLNEPSLESKTSSTTCIAVDDKKTRPSRNNRRSSNISASTEHSTPGEAPPLTDHSPDSPMGFSIDEIFQSTQREKKVRRSMRLRRDSGVGLSWVEESRNAAETGRRRSLRSMEKPPEHPTRSPNKENLRDQPAYSASRKARRTTLGTATLQESAPTYDTKRRRSNSSVYHAAAMASQNVSMPDA